MAVPGLGELPRVAQHPRRDDLRHLVDVGANGGHRRVEGVVCTAPLWQLVSPEALDEGLWISEKAREVLHAVGLAEPVEQRLLHRHLRGGRVVEQGLHVRGDRGPRVDRAHRELPRDREGGDSVAVKAPVLGELVEVPHDDQGVGRVGPGEGECRGAERALSEVPCGRPHLEPEEHRPHGGRELREHRGGGVCVLVVECARRSRPS